MGLGHPTRSMQPLLCATRFYPAPPYIQFQLHILYVPDDADLYFLPYRYMPSLTNYDLLYIRSLMMLPMKYIYIDDEDHDLHGVWSCSKSYYSHCCWLIKFLKIFWVYFHILWFDSYYQWTDICWKQSNCLKWKLVLFFNLLHMVLSSGFI